MNKEEAIQILADLIDSPFLHTWEKQNKALHMAIEALQIDIVKCENCKYQDECEEVVLFEVTDDEVIGHRVHWCSYGRSE